MKTKRVIYAALVSGMLTGTMNGSAADPAGKSDTNAAVRESAAEDISSWLRQTRQKLIRQEELTSQDFDRLFSDEFFRGSEDPLGSIERLNARLEAEIDSERGRFKKAYDKWFSERMDMGSITPVVQETQDKVTVMFRKPAESPGSKFKVDVNRNRIKVDYESRSDDTERTNGKVVKSSSYRHNEKIMSVPQNADPYRYRLEDKKDSLTIIFDKKK